MGNGALDQKETLSISQVLLYNKISLEHKTWTVQKEKKVLLDLVINGKFKKLFQPERI